MAGPSQARHAGYQMRVADEIESFIAEVEAALGGADDRFGWLRLPRPKRSRPSGAANGGCAMSFLLFQAQLSNFSLAIQDKTQEQKMFAHFGAI